ncbi:MAG: hypothetical protein ACPG09_00055, partial [Paracoccaceae bacterium]
MRCPVLPSRKSLTPAGQAGAGAGQRCWCTAMSVRGPTIGWSLLIGGIGGAIVVYGVPLLDKLNIDDVVGAIPVHLFAGIWGTLAVVLTNSDASLGTQIYSILVVGLFVVVASAVVWLILKAITGIRVSEEDEINGLDMSELGMDAYPDFSKST